MKGEKGRNKRKLTMLCQQLSNDNGVGILFVCFGFVNINTPSRNTTNIKIVNEKNLNLNLSRMEDNLDLMTLQGTVNVKDKKESI